MSRSPVKIETSQKWDEILFPVKTVPLKELLPDYQVRASDRQNVIIGNEKTIYGIQGLSYTLVPNQVLYDAVNTVIGDHEVKIIHTQRGEFSINVHLPSTQYTIGDRKDTLQKSLIFGNSYNGRAKFTVQGSVMGSATDRVRERGMKVSYYREICSNGLHAWADVFMTMDEYLDWLLKGQPNHYEKVKQVKTQVDEGIGEVEREKEEILRKSYRHRHLKLDLFIEELIRVLHQFMDTQDSLSLKVYERMQQHRLTQSDVNQIMVDVGLPKRLATLALERLDAESRYLKEEPNAWLAYNAMNFSLFSDKSGLTLDKRYETDQLVFNNMNQLLLV